MNKLIKYLCFIAILAVSMFLIASTRTPDNKLKIGLIAPLSGPASDSGEYMKNAALLASEELGNIEIIVEDSQYTPIKAVSSLRKLIEADAVPIIIGPYSSSEVEAIAPIVEERKIVTIIPGAQSENISYLGDFIFRLIHNTAQEAPVFAEYIATHDEVNEIDFLAINVSVTDPYLKSFIPSFEKYGKKVGLVERYDPSVTDFRSLLVKFKERNSKALFLISPPKYTGLVIEQAQEMNFFPQFYALGVESPELVKIAGHAADGLVYPYSYDSEDRLSSVQEFITNYKNRFGSEPDTVAANVYDAINLIHNCTKDSVVAEKIRDCLYETKEYKGASGIFSIDTNGDAVKNIFIKTIENGKFIKKQ